MKQYRIAVLRGDGIGPEIVAQAIRVLNTAAERFGFSVCYEEALLGGAAGLMVLRRRKEDAEN